MAAAPPRYLVVRQDDGDALLRFPPGVTLEDAGCDWWPIDPDIDRPALPEWAVERLRGLGVEVVASGCQWLDAFSDSRNIAAPLSSVDAFAEDYLGVNARLGGERCVTVDDYAMHTILEDRGWLGDALGNRLLERGGVRVYGGAAFREGDLPDTLRLRVWDIALGEACVRAPDSMPCLLHGGGCRRYHVASLGEVVYYYVDWRHKVARVEVPRWLLDEAGDSVDPRQAARAVLGVVRRVFEALPGNAWDWGGGCLSRDLASIVALTVAETCEEHAMLVRALRRCRSLGGMERLAQDPSWAVSRALENLRDRW